MESPFDLLPAVVPGMNSWRLKVRVARICEVPTFLKTDHPNSLEIILIDEKVLLFRLCRLYSFGIESYCHPFFLYSMSL